MLTTIYKLLILMLSTCALCDLTHNIIEEPALDFLHISGEYLYQGIAKYTFSYLLLKIKRVILYKCGWHTY